MGDSRTSGQGLHLSTELTPAGGARLAEQPFVQAGQAVEA
jgi:hypothetical protein